MNKRSFPSLEAVISCSPTIAKTGWSLRIDKVVDYQLLVIDVDVDTATFLGTLCTLCSKVFAFVLLHGLAWVPNGHANCNLRV